MHAGVIDILQANKLYIYTLDIIFNNIIVLH